MKEGGGARYNLLSIQFKVQGKEGGESTVQYRDLLGAALGPLRWCCAVRALDCKCGVPMRDVWAATFEGIASPSTKGNVTHEPATHKFDKGRVRFTRNKVHEVRRLVPGWYFK